MKIEYSAAVTLALGRAAALAQQEGRAEPTAFDLIRGLTAEGEGQAAALLRDAGLDLERFLATYPAIHWTGGQEEGPPQVPGMRRILAQARDMARWHSAEGTVTSDQLLLAILESEPEVRQVLAGFGLEYGKLQPDQATQPPPLPLDEPLHLDTPRDRHDQARIMDAAANRAREGLRVLEDYSRFALDDALLSGMLKTMRHDLAQALAPFTGLAAARDTLHDVGTDVKAGDEHQRGAMRDVLQANARRVQEALRTLEEFAKWGRGESDSGDIAGVSGLLEKLRYQAYTLEHALLVGSAARDRLAHARLYVLVTEAGCRASLTGTVREALAGGADVIQLREKNLSDASLLEKAREVRRLTRAAGALFIVNDRPDIAALAQAEGVHLGQEDLPLREARRILGPDALIGVSTHNLDQVRRAVLEGASYLGVGPTFPSQTKTFDALAGLEFVRQATAATNLPSFVLGGVTLENLAQVRAAGGMRVAVSQAICMAEDVKGMAGKMRRGLEGL